MVFAKPDICGARPRANVHWWLRARDSDTCGLPDTCDLPDTCGLPDACNLPDTCDPPDTCTICWRAL